MVNTMKKVKDCTLSFILCSAIVILIVFSQQAKAGARDGIALCENIIIPSLLPILIISNLIIKSRCAAVIEFIFAPIFEKLFRLPGCCASPVILGLVGGYPTGAVLTKQLYLSDRIDEKTANRLMHFNFCGGAAFIICVVGSICYSSIKTGVVLYISNLLSSVIICLFDAFFERERVLNNRTKRQYLSMNDALVEAVNTTVNSLLVMCAYIILFSAVTSIIPLPEYMYALFEITNGICSSKTPLPLEYCSLFTAFGGFCIHFQLLGMLREMKINYFSFFLYRVAGAILSFGITKLFVRCFEQTAAVFSNITQAAPKLSTVNTGLSLLMVIGCAVIILEIENKKIKLP